MSESEDFPIDRPMNTTRKSGYSKLFKQTIPGFVLEEYPLMVDFLEAYYEWLDQEGNPVEFLQNSQRYFDVDTTSTKFLEHFKSNFLNAFPQNLTIHSGKTLDQRVLIKNIRNFYKLKGSEKSISLLFKIIADSDTRIEYPRENIFTLSGANYKDYRILYLIKDYSNFSKGFDLMEVGGLVVTQEQGFLAPVASATIESGYEIKRSGKKWVVLIISDTVGEFIVDDAVPLTINQNGVPYKWYLGSCVKSLDIKSGGNGYFTGDRLFIGNTTEEHIKGIVTLTNESGAISAVDIFDHPVSFRGNTAVSVVSDEGTGASFSVSFGGMSEIISSYINDKNIIGRESRIQDSHYYQQYSYVVKSKRSLEEYIDAIKTIIHPSGFIIFNDLHNNISVIRPTEFKTRIVRQELPQLGAYAFYSPTTIDDYGNTYFKGWNPGNCFEYGGSFSYWGDALGDPLTDGSRINPSTPIAGFYGLGLYMNIGGSTLSYGSGETGLQADGLTLRRGFPHPNTRAMTEIGAGVCFANIKIGDFLNLLIRQANSGGTGWETEVQSRMLLGTGDTPVQNSTVKIPASNLLIYDFNKGRKTDSVKAIKSASVYEKYSIVSSGSGSTFTAEDDIPLISE